jgi:transposase
MQRAQEQLERIAGTARKGRYYSWVRLREKANDILRDESVKGLYRVDISPLEAMESPEEKVRLKMVFEPDEEAIEKRKAIEGKYVLQTSLDPEKYPAEKVDEHYRSLMKTERAFRHIKSYLKIRPVYHYKRERVRAHVLICFLAYYLVKKMELEMREAGEEREVELVLRHWDTLRLSQYQLNVGEHSSENWQWSLGEEGQEIEREIKKIGWWRSLSAYGRSLCKKLL